MRGVTISEKPEIPNSVISTHTPHARRDGNRDSRRRSQCEFQLTRLMRGVTNRKYNGTFAIDISTHTPHARRDTANLIALTRLTISTHTPHARRDGTYDTTSVTTFAFQLTRLMRGVTLNVSSVSETITISTHTPHARRDESQVQRHIRDRYFNSHASCEA